MPPFVVPNDPVPTVPPPIGALLTFASPDGGADVFGTLDVRVTMTGLPTCERLELYLDDAKQDEAMSKIGRNRYIQTVQTSFCADGRHRFAVVARDAQKKIIATSARDVFFRNVGNIHVMSALPTPADDGYEIALRVNALRVRLGPESFALADWVRGRTRALPLRVDYRGDEINGIPVATLTASLPAGESAWADEHHFVLTLKDNTGATSTHTEFRFSPPRA